MKKISCIGFHCSGSGAVEDFLRGFNNIVVHRDSIECRFLQDPDGVSDLQYNLLDNYHRLNSEFAIRRFINYCKYYNHTYSLIFGKEWKRIYTKYISNLIDFEYLGYWDSDVRELSDITIFFYKIRRVLSKLSPIKPKKTPENNYFRHMKFYQANNDKTNFFNATKEFVNDLGNVLIKNDNQDTVFFDQLFSTTNIKRYFNYVDNIKVIIVDRDPRDIYIEETSHKYHVLPHDAKKFALQYKKSRETLKEELENDNVLLIQFEDLIYDYANTTKLIVDFLDLDISKFDASLTHFNPEQSKKNTKLWKSKPEFSKEAELIEQIIPEYCRNYD